MFALSWTAVHPITPESPLHGTSQTLCQENETDLIVTLIGFDESLRQTIHARHAYRSDQILFGKRFADLFSFGESGIRTIDYRRFNQVEPAPLTMPGTGAEPLRSYPRSTPLP